MGLPKNHLSTRLLYAIKLHKDNKMLLFTQLLLAIYVL